MLDSELGRRSENRLQDSQREGRVSWHRAVLLPSVQETPLLDSLRWLFRMEKSSGRQNPVLAIGSPKAALASPPADGTGHPGIVISPVSNCFLKGRHPPGSNQAKKGRLVQQKWSRLASSLDVGLWIIKRLDLLWMRKFSPNLCWKTAHSKVVNK